MGDFRTHFLILVVGVVLALGACERPGESPPPAQPPEDPAPPTVPGD